MNQKTTALLILAPTLALSLAQAAPDFDVVSDSMLMEPVYAISLTPTPIELPAPNVEIAPTEIPLENPAITLPDNLDQTYWASMTNDAASAAEAVANLHIRLNEPAMAATAIADARFDPKAETPSHRS